MITDHFYISENLRLNYQDMAMSKSIHSRPLSLLERVLIPIVQTAANASVFVKSSVEAPEHRPTFCKAYPCRPMLRNRFYLPPSADSETDKKYPLVIQIHGGAWAIYSPAVDDVYCGDLAKNSSVVVANINYRKAHQHRFPIGLEDCIAIVKAVLADSDLPIDPARVVISGMSAGGNFALVLSQMQEFRGALRGVIAWYPVVDFVTPLDEKMKHRVETEEEDMLFKPYGAIQSAYLNLGDDCTEVKLSVTNFDKRQDFPENVYIIGAEQDLLCWEARVMAEKLAEGVEKKPNAYGWTTDSGITWELAERQTHAFDQFKQKRGREVKRKEVAERIREHEAAWLFRVFA